MSPLTVEFGRHQETDPSYADDIQLYCSFKPSEFYTCSFSIDCLSNISQHRGLICIICCVTVKELSFRLFPVSTFHVFSLNCFCQSFRGAHERCMCSPAVDEEMPPSQAWATWILESNFTYLEPLSLMHCYPGHFYSIPRRAVCVNTNIFISSQTSLCQPLSIRFCISQSDKLIML